MIIVALAGGLGNQLFQYAAARRLALRTGRSLRFDLGFFRQAPDREFALGKLRVQGRALGALGQAVVDRYAAPRYARWRRWFPIRELTERDLRAYRRPGPWPTRLSGYFQNERFFADVAL